jgi:hypothetical protein
LDKDKGGEEVKGVREKEMEMSEWINRRAKGIM